MADTFKIKIHHGKLTMIYHDVHAGLLAQGKASITRASNVEPTTDGKGWQATMSDGTVLPATTLRQDALAAEVEYLERKLFR
jgi:hypothetical protein